MADAPGSHSVGEGVEAGFGTIPPGSRAQVIRWGGAAALAGGAVYVLQGLVVLVFSPLDTESLPIATISLGEAIRCLIVGCNRTYSIALAGILGGIVALHAAQTESPRYGWLGTSAASFAMIGFTSMLIAPVAVGLTGGADFSGLYILGYVSAIIGLAILGIVTLVVRILPVWSGVLLTVGFPVTTVSETVPGGTVLLGIIWVLLGYVLWSTSTTGDSDSQAGSSLAT